MLRVSMAPDCGFYQVRNREPVLGCHGSRLRDHVVARLRPESQGKAKVSQIGACSCFV